MSKADLLRAFWIPDLYQLTGQMTSGLAKWIGEANYSLSQTPTSSRFSLDVLAPLPLTMAYAYDIGRMASASFETIVSISPVVPLPRSMGWFVIKAYYSAFFAAHCISRIFGTSCSQLSAFETRAVRVKANAIGITTPQSITAGNYTCVYRASAQKLECVLNSGTGGLHSAFWRAFGDVLDDLSSKVMVMTTETASNKQPVYSKLIELRDTVSNGWLSELRNEVNYKHLLGCWYPYKDLKKSERESLERSLKWDVDPMVIPLNPSATNLRNFVNTCCFLVALCKTLTSSISTRCPGKSFLDYQSAPILRLVRASAAI